MKHLAPFALVLVLAACGTTDPRRAVAIACQGYASTLTSLSAAKARGQLTGEQIATVDNLRPGLNAICLHGDYSDPRTAREAVDSAMLQLLAIQETAQ